MRNRLGRRVTIVSLGSVLAVIACSATVERRRDADDPEPDAGAAGGDAGNETTPEVDLGIACEEDCTKLEVELCQTGACDPSTGTCVPVPVQDGTPCDDSLWCTENDACQAGACVGSQKSCGAQTETCAVYDCDDIAEKCVKKILANGTPCPNADLCTINSACKNGLCIGNPKDCYFAPMPDECHVGVCNPGTGKCDPVPGNDGQPCPSGGELCLVDKVCSNGACTGGVPKDCSALDSGCTVGVCQPADGSCYPDPIPPGGLCAEATDACNVGICDMNGVCQAVPANEGLGCSDGNACTVGETCQGGLCTGGQAGTLEIYFTEPFADNTAGWTLDSEWQIGPATASDGTADSGYDDPAQDHTATPDNGVAGVVIGGYAAESIHPFAYLTSPPLDATVAPGPLYLEYWRWLNSDYPPYMTNVVEVWNGSSWTVVWTTNGSVLDSAWQHMNHDITAHKNAALRVRFGFKIESAGVYKVSSWNLDDVALVNQVCN